METLWQDLRYGLRMLVKRPGFTAMAVFTLALGIGATTTIFSMVNAVLLNPLPFPESGRLVALGQTYPAERARPSNVSHRNFTDWREQNQTFERLAAYYVTTPTLIGEGDAARLRGAVVTADLFPLLGVSPALGRAFTPDDDKAGGGADGLPAILSWECWQQRFGADPGVIGRTITLDDEGFTVVGVMPAGFGFPIRADRTEVWLSTARDARRSGPGTIMVARGYLAWNVVGRLKPGVTVEQAQADMDAIAASLAAQYPDDNTDVGVRALPLLDWLVGDTRATLLVLLGAVGFVLLIACANVANLMLERGLARHKEISIRQALGAGRWRIVRQLLTESVLLAGAGGALGVLLAAWSKDLVVALSPANIARIAETRLDARVLAFTVLASLLTGVLFGLVPALTASRVQLTESLKEGGRGSTDGLRLTRTRNLLVVAEVALALVLLTGAGLLARSFMQLQAVNPGFDTGNVLTFTLGVSGERYREPERVAEFYRQAIERLGALPGVMAASAVSHLPLSGGDAGTGLEVEGRPVDPGNPIMGAIRAIGPDYFRVIGMRLVRGRDFNAQDTLNAPAVLIVNEALAREYFPGEDPISKRIRPSFSVTGRNDMREIVGVVNDVKHRGLSAEARPEIYFPHAQMPVSGMTVALRAAGDPHRLVSAAQDEIRALDHNVPVYRVRTLADYVSLSVAAPRFNTLLIGMFAAAALFLTVVGLYGVISFAVSQSTHEIGIRMALGAQAGDVLRLVLGQGMALTLIGVAVGLVGAFALTRLIESLLFRVSATDPLTFAGVGLLLAAVALTACYVPARRATKVDPMEALRHE